MLWGKKIKDKELYLPAVRAIEERIDSVNYEVRDFCSRFYGNSAETLKRVDVFRSQHRIQGDLGLEEVCFSHYTPAFRVKMMGWNFPGDVLRMDSEKQIAMASLQEMCAEYMLSVCSFSKEIDRLKSEQRMLYEKLLSYTFAETWFRQRKDLLSVMLFASVPDEENVVFSRLSRDAYLEWSREDTKLPNPFVPDRKMVRKLKKQYREGNNVYLVSHQSGLVFADLLLDHVWDVLLKRKGDVAPELVPSLEAHAPRAVEPQGPDDGEPCIAEGDDGVLYAVMPSGAKLGEFDAEQLLRSVEPVDEDLPN